MAYLYILKNNKGKYYVGITELEVEERLVRHNKGHVMSTKINRPWHVVLIENFTSMSEARVREKKIKSWKGGNAFKKLVSDQSCGIV